MNDRPHTPNEEGPADTRSPALVIVQKGETLAKSKRPRQLNDEPNLMDVVAVVFDRIDPLIKLIESFGGQALKAREAEGRFKTRMAWFAAGVVGIVVGVSGFLTYAGKMDGSTFGFLLGLVVGYVLSFIRDAIYPPKQQ